MLDSQGLHYPCLHFSKAKYPKEAFKHLIAISSWWEVEAA